MNWRFFILMMLLLIHVRTGAQIYTGSFNQQYHCSMRIHSDSSVQLVYSYNNNRIYAEYEGTIRQHTDTSYRLNLELVFGQFFKRSYSGDTMRIQIDTPHIKLDRILLSYSNGTYRELSCTDRRGYIRPVVIVPVNKLLFNGQSGFNEMTITVNRKDPIHGRLLEFKIPYGACASFTAKRPLEFDVILGKEELRFLDEPFPQTSNMVMKCTRK